ncbi:MAG: hypothetical protein ABI696_15875, partial [Rubrivivax sp.]
ALAATLPTAAPAAPADSVVGADLAPLHQACRRAPPAALRSQLRALLHYHLGGAALRTRQVVQEVQRLRLPPSPPPPDRDRR